MSPKKEIKLTCCSSRMQAYTTPSPRNPPRSVAKQIFLKNNISYTQLEEYKYLCFHKKKNGIYLQIIFFLRYNTLQPCHIYLSNFCLYKQRMFAKTGD